MKKTLFAAIALVMGTGILHAEHVDKSAAREAAAQFMQGLNPQASLIAEPAQKAPRRNAEGAASSTEAYYYIFNAKNNQGFVIISGDDRTPQVLGYSDKGMIDSENVPVNLQEMLDSYEAQIKLLDTMSDYEAGKAMGKRRTKDATRNSISPMITTNWDQAEPYWNKLPHFMKSNDEDETEYELPYTGCVATSMAQIMKYYNFPEKTTQAIPSYTFTISGDNYSYSTATMDELPITTFDWAHMLDNYTGAEDEVYTDAVANLMLYVGHAVKMAYGTSASGAYTDEIPGGFTKYFGYNPNTIRIVYRNDYAQDDWNDLIYSELAAGRPMVYNGTAGSGGGHSFICDGFESGDYFHINWGWGGMSNGFFLLEVLNPHASGIGGASSSEGYNMKQNAIIGIQPGDASAVEPTPVVENLTATNLYWNYNSSSVTLYTNDNGYYRINKNYYLNVGCSDHTGTGKKYAVGIDLYDATGTEFVEHIWGETLYQTRATSATGLVTQIGKSNATNNSITFGRNLAAGTYRIVPVCQLQGSSEWVPMLESDRYYVEFVVSGYDYATAPCHPSVSLEATNYEYIGGEKVGSAERVDVTLKNNGPDRFHGNLYLFVDNEQIDEYGQYITVIEAELAVGEEKTVTFNFTPKNAGTNKTVKVCLDEGGEKVISGTSSITVAAADAGTMNLEEDISAVNCVARTPEEGEEYPIHGNIYDTHAKFKVTLTNNDTYEYHRYILVPLFICTESEKTSDDGTVTKVWGGQMVTYKMETITLAAGETKDFYYEFDNLAPGSVYSVNVYARNDNPDDATGNKTTNLVASGMSKYYKINYGVVSWTSAGVRTSAAMDGAITVAEDAAAVSIMGLGNEVQITPNDNPNCLYFLDADQTVPTGLEGKNVIKGYVAENIVLADGYDYYTPYTFEATNISYSRTFTQGRATEGGEQGWETLVLPFETTEVDANGTAVSWYTSDNDTEGKFWLCNFAEEEGDETYFSYATKLAADRPYLIAVPENLVGSTLTFKGTNAKLKPGVVAVTSGKVHSLVGTYVKTSVENAYKMNAVGHQFDLAAAAQEIASFHAYFNTLEGKTSDATVLPINFKLTGDVTLTGDVNLDGVVDLADVTALVNYRTNVTGNYGETDIDGDGDTDDDDVAALVNILLAR